MAFKMKKPVLQAVSKELKKASKTHAGQAKKIDSVISALPMKSPMDKKAKKGKKDACYYKIKRSAKVWPSAYASGRLVQCRKVGAANYGKGKKKK
mgnify:FL=1|jgi:mRNA-degrading endonuclease YafQ of YafQ-DinJ toxin-antitoxin module